MTEMSVKNHESEAFILECARQRNFRLSVRRGNSFFERFLPHKTAGNCAPRAPWWGTESKKRGRSASVALTGVQRGSEMLRKRGYGVYRVEKNAIFGEVTLFSFGE